MMEEKASRSEDILLLESNPSLLHATAQYVSINFPSANVVSTSTLEECCKIVNERDFDIVIVDYDLKGVSEIGFVHQLRVKDNEPAVLLISESVEPNIVNEISSLGCQRYLHKQGDWFAHLGSAIRQLLRIRRLEEENRKLVAQLTEAKMFLEEKNRRLDEFSATVAHDIRGPLGGVTMKLEFILERLSVGLEDRTKTLLERALDSTRRLIDIVQAMYNYAKLGTKAAKMGDVDLSKLIEEVIEDLSFEDSLDIKIGLGELPQIWGSAELLRRVFINLISNSVKYTDKTEIIINVYCDAIIEKTLGNFVRLIISDNGPGIAPDDRESIFAMFQRGPGEVGTSDGLGVGLSVVRRIVELHYGEIKVESTPGEGTRFIITLPAEKMEFLG